MHVLLAFAPSLSSTWSGLFTATIPLRLWPIWSAQPHRQNVKLARNLLVFIYRPREMESLIGFVGGRSAGQTGIGLYERWIQGFLLFRKADCLQRNEILFMGWLDQAADPLTWIHRWTFSKVSMLHFAPNNTVCMPRCKCFGMSIKILVPLKVSHKVSPGWNFHSKHFKTSFQTFSRLKSCRLDHCYSILFFIPKLAFMGAWRK